jgi:hypothetical protein
MSSTKVFPLLFLSLVTCLAAYAKESPLLNALPPCPAPANLPESDSATYEPARQKGQIPADIGGAPPAVSLDIPLGVPLPSVTKQASDFSLSQVPVADIELREGKVKDLRILGQSPTPQPLGEPISCTPAPNTQP